jgi:hypothetical protein
MAVRDYSGDSPRDLPFKVPRRQRAAAPLRPGAAGRDRRLRPPPLLPPPLASDRADLSLARQHIVVDMPVIERWRCLACDREPRPMAALQVKSSIPKTDQPIPNAGSQPCLFRFRPRPPRRAQCPGPLRRRPGARPPARRCRQLARHRRCDAGCRIFSSRQTSRLQGRHRGLCPGRRRSGLCRPW